MFLRKRDVKKQEPADELISENTAGQLYTIEGIAAGLIMIMTAYLVVSATSVYTAGDTHISDMQLEQLGTDALKVMDAPVSRGENSLLQDIIEKTTPVGTSNATFGLDVFQPCEQPYLIRQGPYPVYGELFVQEFNGRKQCFPVCLPQPECGRTCGEGHKMGNRE